MDTIITYMTKPLTCSFLQLLLSNIACSLVGAMLGLAAATIGFRRSLKKLVGENPE